MEVTQLMKKFLCTYGFVCRHHRHLVFHNICGYLLLLFTYFPLALGVCTHLHFHVVTIETFIYKYFWSLHYQQLSSIVWPHSTSLTAPKEKPQAAFISFFSSWGVPRLTELLHVHKIFTNLGSSLNHETYKYLQPEQVLYYFFLILTQSPPSINVNRPGQGV